MGRGDMLGRRTCRDMRDMWWRDGDMRDMRDMLDMRDGPPPRNRPGRAAVFGPVPPICEGQGTGAANDQQSEKRMLIFDLTC